MYCIKKERGRIFYVPYFPVENARDISVFIPDTQRNRRGKLGIQPWFAPSPSASRMTRQWYLALSLVTLKAPIYTRRWVINTQLLSMRIYGLHLDPRAEFTWEIIYDIYSKSKGINLLIHNRKKKKKMY